MPDPGDLGPFKEPKMGELNPKMVEYDEAPFLPSGISPIEAISAVVQHSARQQPLQSTASAMNAKVIYASVIEIGDIPPGDYYSPLAAAVRARDEVVRALVSVPEAGDVMCLFPDLNRVNGGGHLSVLDKTILAMYRVVYGPLWLQEQVKPGATIKISDNHIISVVDSSFSAPPPSPEGTRVNRNSFENAPVSMELQDVYSGRNPNEENSNFFEEPDLEVMKDKSFYPDSPLLAAVGTPYSWGAGTTNAGEFWPNGDWSYFFLYNPAHPAIAAQTAPGYDCSGFAQAALVTLGHIPDAYEWPKWGPIKRNGKKCSDIAADQMYDLAAGGAFSEITLVSKEEVERGDLAMYPGHVEVVNGPMKPDGLIEIIGASGGGSKTYSNNRKAYVKIKRTHKGSSQFKGFVRVRAGST